MKTYYRLFYLPDHYKDWNEERYNSYHNSICGAWIEAYKAGKRNVAEYELKQPEGTYTQRAAENYIKLQTKYKLGTIWNDEDRMSASELDGVCAFEDLKSAINYAGGAESEGRAIVSFEGIPVSKIPESNCEYSGILVKPTRTISIKSLEKYRKEV
jgi:hypothetical protein